MLVYVLFSVSLFFPFHAQEIKFDPNVMVEHIDKKVSFRASQVYDIHCQFVLAI